MPGTSQHTEIHVPILAATVTQGISQHVAALVHRRGSRTQGAGQHILTPVDLLCLYACTSEEHKLKHGVLGNASQSLGYALEICRDTRDIKLAGLVASPLLVTARLQALSQMAMHK